MTELMNKLDGILLFGGVITAKQLLIAVVMLVVGCIVISVFKKTMRLVMFTVTMCGGMIYLGIASPSQIKDVASQVTQNGVQAYQSFASASDNIRISGKNLQIKADGNWYNISDITAVSGRNVIINGEGYVVDDENIFRLLETFY